MNSKKPMVRKAKKDDFDKVYPLLKKMEHGQSSREDWKKLFENHWHLDNFTPGIILETDEQVVGFLSTIYSHQLVNSKQQVFCNLSSWIVDEAYRSYSFMMILSLVRNKDIVLTSYSSNDVSYAVYNKLGFKDGNVSKRIVYPFPSLRALFGNHKYKIITDVNEIRNRINENECQIYEDHCSFHPDSYLITYNKSYCLIMGVKNKNRFEIYTVSDKDFLQYHLKYFRYQFMKILKVKVIWLNENYLNNKFLFLSRKVTWGFPYQYKTSNDSVVDPMPLYSELFLLRM